MIYTYTDIISKAEGPQRIEVFANARAIFRRSSELFLFTSQSA